MEGSSRIALAPFACGTSDVMYGTKVWIIVFASSGHCERNVSVRSSHSIPWRRSKLASVLSARASTILVRCRLRPAQDSTRTVSGTLRGRLKRACVRNSGGDKRSVRELIHIGKPFCFLGGDS